MVTLINNINGRLLLKLSCLILFINPKLNSQSKFIRQIVLESLRNKERIPLYLSNSLILIEDKRYFFHQGIDVYAIFRAIVKNITTNRLEGASTITQQLIRNISEEREIKLLRKLKEIILAVKLNSEFSKNEILISYVTTYKFKNSIGIFKFCQNENYNLNNLTVKNSAELVARFKYPTINKDNYINYLKRVRTIEIKNYTKDNE